MIKVRRLSVGDEALAQLTIGKLKNETPANILTRLNTEYLSEFLSNERNYLLVALTGNQPVGFVLGYRLMRVDRAQEMMLLYEIGVVERNRNHGVGTLLINELKKICREHKIMKMWALTNKSNLAATVLYRRTGAVEDESGDEVTFTYFPEFE
jgi:ribosomal protein S18 acetylase RimI-like enzyme